MPEDAVRFIQVGELADVVNLKVRRFLAELATFGEEPMDQLVAPGTAHDRSPVGEGGSALPEQWDPAEAGALWFSASIKADGDMEDRAGSGGCLDRWLVASSHLGSW